MGALTWRSVLEEMRQYSPSTYWDFGSYGQGFGSPIQIEPRGGPSRKVRKGTKITNSETPRDVVNDPEVDAAIKRILQSNNACFWYKHPDGSISIDKLDPKNKKQYLMPRPKMSSSDSEFIRTKLRNGLPLGDFDCLISVPRKIRSPRKPGPGR